MGTAIAKALIAAGHPVVLVDRDAGRLEALAKSLGGLTTTLALDITDGLKVAALPDLIPERFSRSISSSTMPVTTSAAASGSMSARPTTGRPSSTQISTA
jgi:NAD(P)-dependent dehydrogenase (short-subunit alcohol dehydrogenase family)